MVEASAPGKVILYGEHAVVYGRPAIAAPVPQLRARAVVDAIPDDDVLLSAPDLGLREWLSTAAGDNPLAAAVRQVQTELGLEQLNGFSLTVTSDVPIASGLGSGAAISVAVIRALTQHLHVEPPLSTAMVSRLTYEVERLHHGTPSGIDNTVVAYEMPVYFERRSPENLIEPFAPRRPIHLLVAGTGVRSSTRDVVLDVRRQWESEPGRFERYFDACARLARRARHALEAGDLEEAGRLMSENHEWLVKMTVSSAELDRLVAAALRAGALGAKLSGGGRGGNMIALTAGEADRAVREALLAVGATSVVACTIG